MNRTLMQAADLSEVPELTAAALKAARWMPAIGCLLDRVYPGRPLIITFAYVDWHHLPAFDFFDLIKPLEARFETRFNGLLVRDIVNAWYHRGVPGLGSHADDVAATLRGLIRSIRPSRVITIGQGMGGYAAILFGMLLNADRIVAFGTLSHLDLDEAVRYGDRRFLPVLEQLRADPPKSTYFDLVALGRALEYTGEIHVVFGTHPGHVDGASGSHNAVHALRLARLANVQLHPYPEAKHAVVQWLTDRGAIGELLAGLIGPGDERVEDPRAPVLVLRPGETDAVSFGGSSPFDRWGPTASPVYQRERERCDDKRACVGS